MTLFPKLTRIQPPAEEPVSLAQVKAFLRITHDAEDSMLLHFITAARQAAETYLNCSFISQHWQWLVDHVPITLEAITLPRAPVTQVIEVQCQKEVAGAFTPIALDGFSIDASQRCVHIPAIMGGCTALKITYAAGLASSAAEITAEIKQALLSHVTLLFETRGDLEMVNISPIYTGLREVRL